MADDPNPRTKTVSKLLFLLCLIGAAAYILTNHQETFSPSHLASQETAMRNYQEDHPILVIALAFSVYVIITGLSLPFAAVLTVVIGWFFGFWVALVMVSFASTAGSTLAFLSSRFIFRNTIQTRFGEQLSRFNEALEKEGAFYLFSLRLIPYAPFWVINVVMGLTPIRVATFWWVSQIGMLPGTAVFVYAGASFPTLQKLAEQGLAGILSWQLGLAFVLLSAFPFIARKLMASFKRSTPAI